jgi:hypothetical protein
MNWELAIKVSLIAFFVFQIIGTIWLVGKPREPMTAGSAMVTAILNSLFILAVIYV